MDKKIQKLLARYAEFQALGKKEKVQQVLAEIGKNIKFIQRSDWVNHQICGDFPKVDQRSLVFCCSPAKPCIFRNAVLAKMGLSLEDYTRMKEKSARQIKAKKSARS